MLILYNITKTRIDKVDSKNRIFGCYFSTFYNIFQLDRSLYNFPCFVFLDIWWEGPCNLVARSYVILCNTTKNWQKSFICQSLPRWKAKKERFNTFDAIVNHVKRIDTFQNFNSVLVWRRHTIVQISVVVYKALQKLQGDVCQNIGIFQMCKNFYWLEMKLLDLYTGKISSTTFPDQASRSQPD